MAANSTDLVPVDTENTGLTEAEPTIEEMMQVANDIAASCSVGTFWMLNAENFGGTDGKYNLGAVQFDARFRPMLKNGTRRAKYPRDMIITISKRNRFGRVDILVQEAKNGATYLEIEKVRRSRLDHALLSLVE